MNSCRRTPKRSTCQDRRRRQVGIGGRDHAPWRSRRLSGATIAAADGRRSRADQLGDADDVGDASAGCRRGPRASTRTAPMPPSRCGGLSIGSRAVRRSRRVADRRALIRATPSGSCGATASGRRGLRGSSRGRRPAPGTSTARARCRRPFDPLPFVPSDRPPGERLVMARAQAGPAVPWTATWNSSHVGIRLTSWGASRPDSPGDTEHPTTNVAPLWCAVASRSSRLRTSVGAPALEKRASHADSSPAAIAACGPGLVSTTMSAIRSRGTT